MDFSEGHLKQNFGVVTAAHADNWAAARRSADVTQLWDAFNAGDLPPFVPGVNLTRVADDGSEQWRRLYERVTVSPVDES